MSRKIARCSRCARNCTLTFEDVTGREKVVWCPFITGQSFENDRRLKI